MTDHIEQTISEFQKKLRQQEEEVSKTKDMINRLCAFAGKPPIYTNTELGSASTFTGVRSDEFYGQPLAKAVKKVLEIRKATGAGPAAVKEIYETLKEGGYAFETKNPENAMRGLRISLTKNAALFHKLPGNGRFGLVAWYPKIQAARSKGEAAGDYEDLIGQDPGSADNDEKGEPS